MSFMALRSQVNQKRKLLRLRETDVLRRTQREPVPEGYFACRHHAHARNLSHPPPGVSAGDHLYRTHRHLILARAQRCTWKADMRKEIHIGRATARRRAYACKRADR